MFMYSCDVCVVDAIMNDSSNDNDNSNSNNSNDDSNGGRSHCDPAGRQRERQRRGASQVR